MILVVFLIVFCTFLYTYSTYRNIKLKIALIRTGYLAYIPGSGIPSYVSLSDREFDIETIPTSFFLSLFLHEDRQFIRHNGFNWPEIFRAMKSTLFKKKIRGGSSITQQVAKNLFTSGNIFQQNSTLSTIKRKFIETIGSIALERTLSKEEILYLYLAMSMKFKFPIYGFKKICDYLNINPVGNIQPHEFEVIFSLLPSPTSTIKKCKQFGIGAYNHDLSYEYILLLKRALDRNLITNKSLGFVANKKSLETLLTLELESPLENIEEEKQIIKDTIAELYNLQSTLNRIVLAINPESIAENFLPKWQIAFLHLLKDGPNEQEFLSNLNQEHVNCIMKLAAKNKVLSLLSAEKAEHYKLVNLKAAIGIERSKIQSFNTLASAHLNTIIKNISEISKPFILSKNLASLSPSHPEHDQKMFNRLDIVVDQSKAGLFQDAISRTFSTEPSRIRRSYNNTPLQVLTFLKDGIEINLHGIKGEKFATILRDSTETEVELLEELLSYRILSAKEAFQFRTNTNPMLQYSSLLEALEVLDLGQNISAKEIEEACKNKETIQTNSIILDKLLDTFLFNKPLPHLIKGHVESIILNSSYEFGNLIERLFKIE